MPVCRQCGKLIKPLGIPVSLEEKVHAYLSKILEHVRYESGQRPPRYPMPAVPLITEFVYEIAITPDDLVFDGVSLVMWKPPCDLVHVWPEL